MNDRYQAWAGIGHEKYMDVMLSVLNGKGDEVWRKKVKEMRFETLWPIVDNETCGPIDGYPKPKQMMAFAFTPSAQAAICNALNSVENSIKAAERREKEFSEQRNNKREEWMGYA